MAESEDKGRCINCGFLAKRPFPFSVLRREPLSSFYEIPDSERESGRVWSHNPGGNTAQIETEPVCFRFVADIQHEIDARPEAKLLIREDTIGARSVFAKDRSCQSWYRYMPGLSPRDHFDRLNMELLEQSRREWEMRLETERKDFDLKLFKMSQEIQASNQKVANRFTVAMLILTLVQIFVALEWGRASFRDWVDQLGNLLIQKMSGG
jgi:hypothetical protein